MVFASPTYISAPSAFPSMPSFDSCFETVNDFEATLLPPTSFKKKSGAENGGCAAVQRPPAATNRGLVEIQRQLRLQSPR
mmetsp:Transcript_12727/g.29247  ORF Transcript_12727/g.29247 Transcript_12727/m.29247 type:complete len:80 (-) Transcript_12727:168-407(-)